MTDISEEYEYQYFRFDPKQFPLRFSEALQIVDALLGNEEKIELIFRGVYEKFVSSNRSSSVDSTVLFTEIQNYLKGKEKILIDYGGDDKDDVMATCILERVILLNPKYCVLTVNEIRTFAEIRCKLLLVVKILHEVSHLLTSTFHMLSGLEDISPFILSDTPVKIGTIYDKSFVKGDCGFGMEEDLIGGRLILDTIVGYPYYDKEIIMVLNKSFIRIKDSYVQDLFNFFTTISNITKPAFIFANHGSEKLKNSTILGKQKMRSSTENRTFSGYPFEDVEDASLDDVECSLLSDQANHRGRSGSYVLNNRKT